jgi:hypothetical protein
MALLAALLSMLKIDLRAPNALVSLRLALGAYPLVAIANLRVSATAAVAATATATASAVAALNLSAVANANLSAAAQLVVLMQLLANANFLLMPPGTCGMPCPLALVAAI